MNPWRKYLAIQIMDCTTCGTVKPPRWHNAAFRTAWFRHEVVPTLKDTDIISVKHLLELVLFIRIVPYAKFSFAEHFVIHPHPIFFTFAVTRWHANTKFTETYCLFISLLFPKDRRWLGRKCYFRRRTKYRDGNYFPAISIWYLVVPTVYIRPKQG
jgi:hypothetical protein